ncbi:MAG: anti-sigma F factor [Bacillota bacterium]
MNATNRMKIKFAALPVNVAFARTVAGAFSAQIDFTLNDLEEIKVAVSEAVTNAIVHGYESNPSGEVSMSAEINGETITITVEDCGKGIEDIPTALQPAYSTDPERMGLGFAFMQSFSDKFEVDSEPGRGTRVTMTRVCKKAVNPSQGH